MTSPRLEALLLDIDGTLVDSNDLHARAWVDAFAHYERHFDFDFVRSQMGKGGDLLVPDLLNARDIRSFGDDLKKYRKKLFAERYLPQVKPFPRVTEALRDLHASGIRLVFASSSDADEVDHYIDLLDASDVLKGSTSKDDAAHSKPYPEIFEAALEKVSTHEEHAAVVGDTPYDILAAHRCALPVIAVRCGGFPEATLQKAEFIFDDLPQLVSRIDEVHGYFRN